MVLTADQRAWLAAGYIFYYPPILGLIGVYAIIKGIATGNYDGERPRTRRRRRT